MKILIIKLGAKGDVIRTLPILSAIKERYPDSEIHWLTKPDISSFLSLQPLINEVFELPFSTKEEYDILYNFDIENQATEYAKKVKAKQKFGFSSENDYPIAFNPGAEYYLNTLFDDELKKTNKKTYQQMMFEAAELPYKKQHVPIILNEKDKKYADEFLKKNNLNSKKLIGIHIGASERWPSKKWHDNELKKFIKSAKQKDYEILLFGGPDEIAKQDLLFNELINEGIKIYRNNPNNSDSEFASLVNICKYIICSDSFALHVALALKKPTIALFFCTSPHEVEDYGILKKKISPLLNNFFPEKSDKYSEDLVKSITAEEILKEMENIE